MSRYNNIEIKGNSPVRELKVNGWHVGFVNIYQCKALVGGTRYFRVYHTLEEADAAIGIGEDYFLDSEKEKWELWRV